MVEAVPLRTDFTRGLLDALTQSKLEALDALRGNGFRLGMVSNCTVEASLVWKAPPFGTRFDAAALSCDLGIGKPDPAIYQ